MGIQIIGNGGTVAEVEAAFKSMRATIYPQDPGALGAYSLAVDNGATGMTAALAANSPIFSWRWGNSNIAMLRSVRMGMGATTAFANGRMSFDMFVARAFSASDTGGTAVAFTASKSNAKRTSMGATLLTDARISATGTLTAGTRTLDTNPVGKIHGVSGTTAAQIITPGTVLWQRDSSDEYPLIFAQNEGFVIQATVPATGVWFFSVAVEWMELTGF
jgi:hypothetical protein